MAKPIVRMVEQEKDAKQVLEICGWEEYNMDTRTCCDGPDWCNLLLLSYPVASEETFPNKLVLKTMNAIERANRGVATFMLRVVNWRKVRVGHVVVAGTRMTMAVKPCPNAQE